jgi:hypothetical protein
LTSVAHAVTDEQQLILLHRTHALSPAAGWHALFVVPQADPHAPFTHAPNICVTWLSPMQSVLQTSF